MNDIEVYYENTYKKYNQISPILGTMVKAARRNGQKVNETDFKVNFDILVQFSLMQLAFSNGFVYADEIEFIGGLTKYGDFCDYIKKMGFKEFSWKLVACIDEKRIDEFFQNLQIPMRKCSEIFIDNLAKIDAATIGNDFLDQFIKLVKELYVAFLNPKNESGFNGDAKINKTIMFKAFDELKEKKNAPKEEPVEDDNIIDNVED